MTAGYSLWSFGIYSRFGMFGQKKSGNPAEMAVIKGGVMKIRREIS
jgi:hypothetical protein